MTMVNPTVLRPSTIERSTTGRSRLHRFFRSTPLWLALICSGQIALALRSGLNKNAFEDEGLYLATGHRMIAFLLHGTSVTQHPGAFFSGAPGLYPVLGATADSMGGLAAARDVSLGFAVIATIATYGIGSRLFGKLAGLIGAASFMLCGSVIYLSHFATYDAMTMALVALAAWLAVYSSQRDGFLWGPVVGVLLTLAFLTKYAGAAYIPVVIALAAVVGWPLYGWKIVRRAAFALVATAILAFAAIELWGRDLIPGIVSTTSNRDVLIRETPGHLLGQIAVWVGPWLALAVSGALFRVRRQWALVGVLLVGAIIGPADQVRIGESISLAKHVAFGMVFAAPLIGDLFARGLRRTPARVAPVMLAVFGLLATSGLHYSHQFLTSWVDDRALRPVLAHDLAAQPGTHILGERNTPQMYELRTVTTANQWADTYYFQYSGLIDKPAYAKAIDQHYFGVVYLDLTTQFGSYVHDYLTAHPQYYHLSAKVPRYFHGKVVGHWLVYTPKTIGS
jgi:4-amino-4-deoxy-L-arabinose transferase-like glycosyltransferase